MALIKCKECGKEISSKSESCPSCGNPIVLEKQKEYMGCISGCGLIVIFAFAVFMWPLIKGCGNAVKEATQEHQERQEQ